MGRHFQGAQNLYRVQLPSGRVIHSLQQHLRIYPPGTRVRIRRGPLEGLEAIFDRPMSRAGRVRVLLDLLGQQRRTEVDEVDHLVRRIPHRVRAHVDLEAPLAVRQRGE